MTGMTGKWEQIMAMASINTHKGPEIHPEHLEIFILENKIQTLNRLKRSEAQPEPRKYKENN